MHGRRTRNADAGGVLLASSSAALAIAAHGIGGGRVSDSLFTVLLATLLAWGGSTLARRGGVPALVGVLGVTQLCQHLLLTELARGHGHQQALFDARTMFAAHAVATVLTAVLLARAGVALSLVASTAAWLFSRLTALVAGPVGHAPRPAGTPLPARPGVLIEVLFREVCARRGPPVGS
ncbi:hypothetical protein [Actinophytocola glycyrrhizae]|uniref:MFS transporter n=1 Tax=Actinophytocola glycyrrhizae TaxID=2044873 RepID=A0ABV9S1N6_9PSEU